MKEMGRKPYLADSYYQMMHSIPNAAMWNQIKQKHSEFEKPYRYKAGEYSKMQHYYPNLPGLSPYPDLRFDHPWMGRPVDDAKKSGAVFMEWLGCGFQSFGLFPSIAKCETKCVYLDKFYMHSKVPGGALIPDDPIVSWTVTDNAVITESDIFHACVKVNEDSTESDIVRITGTTQSGLTCNSMGWIKGDECCTTDAAMAWDSETSAETVARNNSVTVAITGLNTPFTWSVSGTGFTLDRAETTGLTNTLNADDTACGTAKITVTGCDNVVATGCVRCTTGEWVIVSSCAQNGGDKSEVTHQERILLTGSGCEIYARKEEFWGECCNPETCGSGTACCEYFWNGYCAYCSEQETLTSVKGVGEYSDWRCS